VTRDGPRDGNRRLRAATDERPRRRRGDDGDDGDDGDPGERRVVGEDARDAADARGGGEECVRVDPRKRFEGAVSFGRGSAENARARDEIDRLTEATTVDARA
jgi:hypothetical protein